MALSRRSEKQNLFPQFNIIIFTARFFYLNNDRNKPHRIQTRTVRWT